jgi:hypothetical protein
LFSEPPAPGEVAEAADVDEPAAGGAPSLAMRVRELELSVEELKQQVAALKGARP